MTRVATDVGLLPSSNRVRLIDLLNRSAKEMHDRLECNRIYQERTVLVPRNKIITFPSFVGQLRGMRTSVSEMPFDIYGMSSPRYVKKTWEYKWANWRDLGDFPLMQLPTIAAPLAILCTPEITPVTLMITGRTAIATSIQENLILINANMVTVNTFTSIESIACVSQNRTSDITISDANGTMLGILQNNQNETKYKMVDVSQFGWPCDSADGQSSYIDILFKKPLFKLYKDTDNFPGGSDYDTAWYYGALWQYYLNSQNKGQDSATYMQQMLTAMNAIKDGAENELIEKVEFGRNRYMDGVRDSTSVDDLHQGSGKPNGWQYYGNWDGY